RLDGIVWIPDKDTRASLALTNTTPNDLIVTLTSNQDRNQNSKTITLHSQEMRVLDLREFIESRTGSITASLLRLEHNGTPGALIATGFALNESTGFSCNYGFVDRSTAKSNQLAGAHVRFGRADVREGFPSGTRFLAPLLIANAGDAA